MRRYIHFRLFTGLLAVVLFWAVILLPTPSRLLAGASKASAPGIVVRSDSESFYLAKINQLRTDKGLASLVIDSRLSLSASQKTNDMISQHYWDHYAPNGTAFSDYIWRDSPKASRVGENLAKCFDTEQAAFDALVASPTHYAIMVGMFTNFGVYEASDPASGCIYTTMHFSYYN
jgi:uncharacterized protein YkwD